MRKTYLRDGLPTKSNVMNNEKKKLLALVNKSVSEIKEISFEMPTLDKGENPLAYAKRISDALKLFNEETENKDPLFMLCLASTRAIFSMLDSEETAKKVAQVALSKWREDNGIRSLTASEVIRHAANKAEADDINADDMKKIAVAFMKKDESGKTIGQLLKEFKLSETSKQVFSTCQAELRKIAA